MNKYAKLKRLKLEAAENLNKGMSHSAAHEEMYAYLGTLVYEPHGFKFDSLGFKPIVIVYGHEQVLVVDEDGSEVEVSTR